MLDYIDKNLFGIELFFLEFKNYMYFMEAYIEKSVKDFEIKYPLKNIEKSKGSNPDYDLHLLESYYERLYEVDTYYPHNFRASFLAQIFSVIEYELKKICDHYHKIKQTDFSLADLNGTDMEKAVKFLKKACKVDFKDLQDSWNEINMMGKIRNRIVHHQSTISRSDKYWDAISNYIKRHNDFIRFKENLDELDKNGQLYYENEVDYAFTIIITSKKINEEFLQTAEKFFKILLEDKLKFS